MSDQFKAIVLNQEGENFTRQVKFLNKDLLYYNKLNDLRDLFLLLY